MRLGAKAHKYHTCMIFDDFETRKNLLLFFHYSRFFLSNIDNIFDISAYTMLQYTIDR